MNDLNMNGLPVPLADIKDMDDCIIQGINVVLSNEEIVNQWDAKVRRRIAGKLSVCVSDKVFEDVLKDYLRILNEQARNFREKNVLKDKIQSHIKVFHLLCQSSRDFVSTYLNYVESILLVLCNLELDVVRQLKKNRMGKDYNKTVKRIARRLIDNLSINLQYNEKRVFHVLLKLDYKHEQAWKDVMHIVYNHYLINLPVTDKSKLSFCRYYLLFQKWKTITEKEKHQVMDKILFAKFNMTADSITSSKTLKSILLPSTESVVDLVDVLTNGQQVAVNAYFKYIDEKSEDDEIRIPQAIELDSDDEDMSVSLFAINERDKRLNGTVKAESNRPVESAHYVEVPSSNGQVICVIDDDSDIEEVTVLTKIPRSQTSSRSIPVRPVLSFLDSISLPEDEACDSQNVEEETPAEPPQADIPILTAFIDSVRRNRTLMDQDSEMSDVAPLPEKTSDVLANDVVCQTQRTTDADCQTQEKEASQLPEKRPVCQCSCKSLSVESNVSTTKPSKSKDLRTVEIQTDNLESFSYFCGMVTPPSDRNSDENSPESMETIHDTELHNNHANNTNVYTYIRRDSFSETSSQNHYESDIDTHLGVCEMSTQIDGFDPPEPQEKEPPQEKPDSEPRRSPAPPEKSPEPPDELPAESSMLFSESRPEKTLGCPGVSPESGKEPQKPRSPEPPPVPEKLPEAPQTSEKTPEPLQILDNAPEPLCISAQSLEQLELELARDAPEARSSPQEPSESEQRKENAQQSLEEEEFEGYAFGDLETEIELHDETLPDLPPDDEEDLDDDEEGNLMIDEGSEAQEQQVVTAAENVTAEDNINIVISENVITSESGIQNGEIVADISSLPIIIQADQVGHEFPIDLILDSYQLVPLTDQEGNEQNITIINVATEVEADTTTVEADTTSALTHNHIEKIDVLPYSPATCKIQASVSVAEAINTAETPKPPRNGELLRARRKSVDSDRIIFTSNEKVKSAPLALFSKFEQSQSEFVENAFSGPIEPIGRVRSGSNSNDSFCFFDSDRRSSPIEGGSPLSPPYENIHAHDYQTHVENMSKKQPQQRVNFGRRSPEPEPRAEKRKLEEAKPAAKRPRVNFGETNVKFIPGRKKKKKWVDHDVVCNDSLDEFKTNHDDPKLLYLEPQISVKIDTPAEVKTKQQELKVQTLLSSIYFEQRMKAESSCIMKRVDYKKDTDFVPSAQMETSASNKDASSTPLPPSGYVPPLVAAKSDEDAQRSEILSSVQINESSVQVANSVQISSESKPQVDICSTQILNLTVSSKPSAPDVNPDSEFSRSPKLLQNSDQIVEQCLKETSEADPVVGMDSNIAFLSNNSNFYKFATAQPKLVDFVSESKAEPDDKLSELLDEKLKNIENETCLPFKKRRMPTLNDSPPKEPVKEEISYPATPMISIAEIEALRQSQRNRTFKTLAERKEMPPLPVFYNMNTTEPSPIITDQFNINNHTYNNPTINYHMSNVPVPFINVPCASYYPLPPILLPFNNIHPPPFDSPNMNAPSEQATIKKERKKRTRKDKINAENYYPKVSNSKLV